MRAPWLALLVLMPVFSGCLSTGQDAGTKEKQSTSDASTAAPFGCDRAREAIVHGPDGEPREPQGPVPIPCLVTSPWRGYEPSIGLTREGTLFLYPAWPDAPFSQSLADRFNGLGIARTKDQGATWTRPLSTIGPVNWHPFTADPFMYVDPLTGRIFMEDLIVPPFNCSNLSFSDDGGQTWRQTLGGCMVWDHVSIFAGKPITSRPTGYPQVVYRCAITAVATTLASTATGCQKSLDGGMTWQPPGQPAFLFGQDGPYAPSTCHGAAHHGIVDHRGWVWLARTWCPDPYVAISKDEGATWERHRIADATIGAAWHDVAIGVDPNGTAYALWIDKDGQPRLAVSHDDGKTWPVAHLVGIPGLKTAGLVALDVGGVGKVAFSYGAHLEDETEPNVHGVVSMGFQADGPEPLFYSSTVNAPSTPLSRGACTGSCSGQNDFITLHIGPDGTPWGAFINNTQVGAGRLWGGASLWDDSDPNGPYP